MSSVGISLRVWTNIKCTITKKISNDDNYTWYDNDEGCLNKYKMYDNQKN